MRSLVCGIALVMLGASAAAQGQASGSTPTIPAGARSLEGAPTAVVETSAEATKRQALTAKEAGEHGLSISVLGGRYFWTSRQNQELTPRTSGEFIYLLTANPGQYVRLTRINDRFSYVEHVDMGGRTVTYFGELRIVLGK